MTTVVFAGTIACKGQDKNVIQVSVEEMKELRKTNKGVLIDVRTPDEVVQGYISGAVFLNYYLDDFDSQIEKYSKEQPIYIYCRSGNRSNRAAEIFTKHGFKKVYNLKGGYKSWVNGKNKIEKNN